MTEFASWTVPPGRADEVLAVRRCDPHRARLRLYAERDLTTVEKES